ncbi:diaminopimelate epimerase [Glycomyces salinus]|uniref:diaminopimelate epimerase n=1 Tax=Glycomyces salinus TaxID=980294 RepID=UPI0027DA237D|nr:diaminopimelate epimerase [Glycomyces salinus]
MTAIDFAKGHGTGNDFIIVPDPADRLELGAAQVAALCDRHRGIGADGLLRVAPSEQGEAKWFMDYRNADGSIAEMCGNGVRVFARYLLEQGMADGDRIPVDTRAGVKTVSVTRDGLSVDMGPAEFGPESQTTVEGATWTGRAVSMGNPHLVCRLEDEERLDALDLHRQPRYDTVLFPEGINVEFVVGTAPRVRMRVHERGVGETLSCGTGACAVGAVALRHAGTPTGTCEVAVPGGTLTVTVTDRTVHLAGPAVIVAEGTARL